MNDITNKARNLRNNMTDQERKLWSIIRGRAINNHKFRRQYPIGNYIVDFVCNEKFLIIEIDGGQHNEISNKLYDERRTVFLETQGYRVLRFWNNEIDNNIEGVYNQIVKFLE